MTEFEKIKKMNISQMAKFIFDLGNGREYCYGHCAYQDDDNCPNDGGDGCLKGVMLWLESEVKEITTAKEAIEQLKSNAYGDYINLSDLQAIDIAISALEKQAPKKVLNISNEYDGEYGHCPCCNHSVYSFREFRRCNKCGQALDWKNVFKMQKARTDTE